MLFPNVSGVWRLLKRLKNRAYTLVVTGGFRNFGGGSVIRGPVEILGESMIEVGHGVYLGPGCWLMALGSPRSDGRPVIQVGDGCSIAGGLVLTAFEELVIGDKVLFGRNVHISDHAHEFVNSEVPIIDQGVSSARPVRVGSGSWIGQGVVICPGVTIGRNAVIGANSVVRTDVPDYAVAAGVPCRVIRIIDAPCASGGIKHIES
jgi:acetyltransferase-like isoleucine patch superfamily enzyme